MTMPRVSLTCWALLVAFTASARADGPIVVRLRDAAEAPGRLVTVADVAELAGGAEAMRLRAARLDLAEVPAGQDALSVSRKQVQFRLALAGLPAGAFRVEGADAARVTVRLVPVKADEVVAAARRALQARLPWTGDEVLIELAQPVLVPMPAAAREEAVEIKAELHPGHRPVGRVQMDVRVLIAGRPRLALPVHFQVRPRHKAVVCRRRVEKGEALDDSNVYFEEQPVDQRSKLALSPKAVAGARAKQPLMPGQVVLLTDVEAAAPGGAAVIVRAQEGVKIQISIGGLRVTAAGQALQEGRAGQLIRVQNVDSKKVLLGRVVGAGLVEVE